MSFASIGLTLAMGALAGALGMAWRWRRRLTSVAAETRETVRVAREQAEAARRANRERWEREKQTLAATAASELEAERQDLADYETELQTREEVLADRDKTVSEMAGEVEGRERVVRETLEAVNQRLQEVAAVAAQQLQKLSELAGMSRDEAIAQLTSDLQSHADMEAKRLVHDVETEMERDAPAAAQRAMALALGRFDGSSHLERGQNAIAIPDSRTFLQFADPAGALQRAFAEEIGCELVPDEAAGTVTVRGDDPMAREVARRVLRQIANRGIRAPDRLRELAHQARTEIDREVQNAGRKALQLAGVGKVHPDIASLLGRLKFRLSYSQNQWKHSLEVAYLAGMLASELGLDAAAARRGGLLHDIGKAMTHDHEGSHAVLGAEAARRCGESEMIANAIGSHHNDEPPTSPIAYLVAAADALSGARPGARRESVTSYITRIEDIQRIAGRHETVRRVDIMHAGREVRVIVAGEERGEVEDSIPSNAPVPSDDDLQPLAAGIARDLEREVAFAGQIRVTVIRESRSVAIAR